MRSESVKLCVGSTILCAVTAIAFANPIEGPRPVTPAEKNKENERNNILVEEASSYAEKNLGEEAQEAWEDGSDEWEEKCRESENLV